MSKTQGCLAGFLENHCRILSCGFPFFTFLWAFPTLPFGTIHSIQLNASLLQAFALFYLLNAFFLLLILAINQHNTNWQCFPLIPIANKIILATFSASNSSFCRTARNCRMPGPSNQWAGDWGDLPGAEREETRNKCNMPMSLGSDASTSGIMLWFVGETSMVELLSYHRWWSHCH